MSERRGSRAASAHERELRSRHPTRTVGGGGHRGRSVRGLCTVRSGLKILVTLSVGARVYFAVHHHATAEGSSSPASNPAVSAATSAQADPAAPLRPSALQWLGADGSGGTGTRAKATLEQPARTPVVNLAPGLYRDASVGGVYYVAPAQLDTLQR